MDAAQLVRVLMSLEKEESAQSTLLLGKKYFVRTVTHYTVGRLISEDDNYLVFENASWVADTGRWNSCLKTGELSEVEPFINKVFVSKAAVVDITEWDHPLPTSVK